MSWARPTRTHPVRKQSPALARSASRRSGTRGTGRRTRRIWGPPRSRRGWWSTRGSRGGRRDRRSGRGRRGRTRCGCSAAPKGSWGSRGPNPREGDAGRRIAWRRGSPRRRGSLGGGRRDHPRLHGRGRGRTAALRDAHVGRFEGGDGDARGRVRAPDEGSSRAVPVWREKIFEDVTQRASAIGGTARRVALGRRRRVAR